ncbi:MAG: DUF924 domain-containing protein [Gammaproteobacteria bacterium]|nr:DUF924 domain-containing protein [Gammaproteobacteria bacterium]
MAASDVRPEDINQYWIGDAGNAPDLGIDVAAADARWTLWYRGGEAVDEEIRKRFGATVQAALAGDLAGWRATPAGALALIILLDQFTRNLFRGTPDAYAGDPHALRVAEKMVAEKQDESLSPVGRIFAYHPFHHAESESGQAQSVALFQRLHDASPADWKAHIGKHLGAVKKHCATVRKFGRFPHRNAILGRESTADESAFLSADPNRYGQ